MSVTKWLTYRRGKKLSTGAENRAFEGDGSRYPVWSMTGTGGPVKKQLGTTGALPRVDCNLIVEGQVKPSGSPGSYPAFVNPFVNTSDTGY